MLVKTLLNLKRGQSATIKKIHFSVNDNEDLAFRLLQHGISEGQNIRLVTKAPLLGDPLLVEVKGAQMALSKSEARKVEIN